MMRQTEVYRMKRTILIRVAAIFFAVLMVLGTALAILLYL